MATRKPDDLRVGSKRRQFVQGYQEALRDVIDAAIQRADDPISGMLDWLINNADNDTTRERVERVRVWADA